MGEKRYRDLHEHIALLEEKGLLIRVSREINKDTELHPLVRWQFRGGIAEEERKAFFFENVTDVKGRKYDIPVVVGAFAANPAVYCTGLGCERDEVGEVWRKALEAPIAPVIVDEGPAQEIVITGDELDGEGKGIDGIPVPISTPGFDNAPYTTCSHWITKDMDTGVPNVGNYRGQIKGPRRGGSFQAGSGRTSWSTGKSVRLPESLWRQPSSSVRLLLSPMLLSKRCPTGPMSWPSQGRLSVSPYQWSGAKPSILRYRRMPKS